MSTTGDNTNNNDDDLGYVYNPAICKQCDDVMDYDDTKCDICQAFAHRICCFSPNWGDRPMPNFCDECWKKMEALPGATTRTLATKDFCLAGIQVILKGDK